jgi:rhomboid protease GluP
MPVGFTPNFTMDVPLDGLTPRQYLTLCVNTANTLDWDIRYVSDSGLIAFSTKKMLKRKQEVTIRINKDHANIRSESIGRQMLDGGRNRDNVLVFAELLAENKASVTPEQLEQTYEELKDRLPASDQDILSKPPEATKGRWAGFFSLFVPRNGYFITPILVDLNIAVFLLMVLTGANFILPDSHSLIIWGANSGSLTLNHQWWRVITCCFVHYGIIHLLLNMYALMYIGIVLEPQLGRLRFATAYLLTGVMASLAGLYWHPNGFSVGASGAIFGMYGQFLALLTTNLIHKIWRGALLASIGIFVGYNLLVGATAGIVGNAAHVGGLVSGILIGYLFYPGLKKPDNPRLLYPAVALAALVVLSTSIVAFKKIPNYYGLYYQQMLIYGKYEKSALAVYKLNSDTPKENWLAAIRDSGIYNWNQAIRVLEETNQLELPDLYKRRNDILIQYCNLRITSYNYFASKITGTVGPGEDSVPIYNVQITELVNSLKIDK